MSSDLLQVRERALEYEFFHKVDEELWQKLREKIEFDNRRQALAETTGITDEVVLDELVAAGISGESMMALSLFPLVWMAWSDGHIELEERAAILTAAEAAGHARDSASFHMIELWIEHRPPAALQKAWQDYVHYLAKTTPTAAYQAFKDNVLQRSRHLADSIHFRYGFHDAESAQEAVLNQIEATFHTTKTA